MKRALDALPTAEARHLSGALRPRWIPLSDGARLPVRIFGRGEPVLMVPGLGMPSATWLPWVLPLSDRFRFYLPELRGQGLAGRMPFRTPDVFESHADDMEELVAALELRDFRLVGYSLGATTSLHLMRRGGFFDDVRAYLHIDQSPFVGTDESWNHGLLGEESPALVEAMRGALEALDSDPSARRISDLRTEERARLGRHLTEIQARMGMAPRRARFMGRIVARGPDVMLPRNPLLALPTLRAYLRGYSEGGHDYREALRQSHTPVTVFAGRHSELYAIEGQRLVADLATRGDLVCFERSGHLLIVKQPLFFRQQLERFLSRH